ncbi:helix-turn-helix domain-containing protein [Asanoa iriomotensis]|uniref:Transcription regulator TrmB N-terminal domain-containing protein n=1 Tax=Asanoa iriomotensis TaxID=234613 RepID=A0ABQ4C1G7_9ACTN|nr:helix-turn-helix domain-containing protein [Asanoa iriomotensis]GIF56625.1 hypothetical protein Air01nite_27200 [Asanoa iriomotensis]
MEHPALSPTAKAVLDALVELGQGTAEELAEKSGKSRATTGRAVKALHDAGLVAPAEGADASSDGTSTQWVVATPPPTEQPAPDPEAVPTRESETNTEPGADDSSDQAPQPDGDGGAEDSDDGRGRDDVEQNDQPAPDQVAPVSRPGDRKVMAIKGVLSDHGDNGATLDTIVQDSGFGHATVIRLLAAMEQADAARRIPQQDGESSQRWMAGPARASAVDPNPAPPRCQTCGQVIRAARTPRPVTAGAAETVNTDGNRPFAKGELEALTVGYLAARPGQPLSPQEIAHGISEELGGRDVSSGAVRNNCAKAALAGRIRLHTETPQRFVYPATGSDDGNS